MQPMLWVAMALLLLQAGCTKFEMDAGSYTEARGGSSAPVAAGGHHKTGKPYQIAGEWYYPLASAAGYSATGVASWYGRDFHGKKTANGEIYDMHAMSAAHKTLPLPSMVRVTNLDNGRSIIVRVNDRGPFVKSRLIDLSYAGARALGYDKKGTARVRVEALAGNTKASNRPVVVAHAPAPITTHPRVAPAGGAAGVAAGGVFVQVGAFSAYPNAQRMRSKLVGFSPVVIQPSSQNGRQIYRVRIGPIYDTSEVETMVLALQQAGYNNAIVVNP